MKDFKSLGMIVVLSVAAFAVTGCDLLAPKAKKTAVKPSASEVKEVKSEEKAVASPGNADGSGPLPAGVLAKVGDWTLTVDEFKARLKGVKQVIKDFDETQPGAKETVLEELVRQQLLVIEGRREKIDQSRDIRNAVRDFENTLIVQELAGKYVKGIQMSEGDAREYYDANPNVFVTPLEKRVSEIVLTTESEAKEVLVAVLQGADFDQTARDRSRGRSAANDGDLGYLTAEPFAQMQSELASLKKGDVSRVFSGPEGYYIIKVTDVKGGEKRDFSAIKDDLVKWLTSQKQQQVVLEKMAEIAKTVKVQVNAQLLKDDRK